MSKRTSWHDEVFFGIHFDLHANKNDAALGSELTYENLREVLLRVKPDWIQCDCKGHPGWTSWPTEVGSTSPGVVKDSLQIHRDVCSELNIKLGMHYSGVIDQRALELHPEWAQVDADGKSSQRATCLLSAYQEELMIPQLIEIIDKYDVDGFWVDGDNWAVRPCYCERCKSEFTNRTGFDKIPTSSDEQYWEEWLAFHRSLFVEYVTRYANAVHERKPDCAVCSNWMYTVRQPEPIAAPVDYLSGDYTPNFGMYRAALESRFLDSRRISWDLMCWGFIKNYSASNRSIFKTAIHLCQEVAEVVALGGAVMIYDKPQRTGHLVSWHHDIIAEVADFCRARKPFCFRSKSASQVAVLHLAEHYYTSNSPSFNYGTTVQPVEGALHVLLENHHSVDLLNKEAMLERINQYKLIVVPQQTKINKQVLSTLRTFVKNGGYVIMSGNHLAHEVGELIGVEPSGKKIDQLSGPKHWGTVYLEIDGEVATVTGQWQPVKTTSAQVYTCVLSDGEPHKDQTDIIGITRRDLGDGAIVAIHGKVFEEYFVNHSPRLREFIKKLIDSLQIEWRVELEGPKWLEPIVREKDDKFIINLINRGAGEMTYQQRMIIDAVPPINNVTLRIRCENRPESVMLQPADIPLEWSYDEKHNTAVVQVKEVKIHDIVVVES